MTSLVIDKNSRKTANKNKNSFNKLKNNITNLQRKIKELHIELSECNKYFEENMALSQKVYQDAFIENLTILYAKYNTLSIFKKKDDRNTLKRFIDRLMNNFLDNLPNFGFEGIIAEIYHDFYGETYREAITRSLKENSLDFLKSSGVSDSR